MSLIVFELFFGFDSSDFDYFLSSFFSVFLFVYSFSTFEDLVDYFANLGAYSIYFLTGWLSFDFSKFPF